jgi:prepilin-type N-terminal cleavage/methylation domain-containing protein
VRQILKRYFRGFTLIELMIVISIISILASILVPNFMKARAQSQFVACLSNCKNMGTALEMYSTDNEGHYPIEAGAPGLERIAPGYISSVPTCQSAGFDTYSESYEAFMNPDAYTFFCTGANHVELETLPDGQDWPQYTSKFGLAARP